jgi:hypothetical protein
VGPPLYNEGGDVAVFGVFNHFALDIDSSDWAHFGAFSTRRATASFAPFLIFIHNDLRIFTAKFKV